MFWRVASFNQTSPVEAVLDRPDFTLEDLLEEDDLIQVGFKHDLPAWSPLSGAH